MSHVLLHSLIQREQRTITIEEAWQNLATDILLLAIKDVRQERDSRKREKAKQWLLSPAAVLFFDVIIYPQFDLSAWVLANCPELEN